MRVQGGPIRAYIAGRIVNDPLPLLPHHPLGIMLVQHGYDNVWALKSVRPAEELARLGIDRKVGRW